MASHGNQKHTAIERHDSQHNHVSQPNPYGEQEGLDETSRHVGRAGFDQAAMREKLNQKRERKDEEQS